MVLTRNSIWLAGIIFGLTGQLLANDLVEPSGLVLVDGYLYSVNDAEYGSGPENKIYKLDTNGRVVQTYFAGENAGNFEAITFHEGIFFLLTEDGRIYRYDRNFAYLGFFQLSRTIRKYVKHPNSGFEGLTSDGRYLYVTIEKGNKFLIRIDMTGEELAKWDLEGLGLKDISDIVYDAWLRWFFVVSHESKAIAAFPRALLTEDRIIEIGSDRTKRKKQIVGQFFQEIPGKFEQAEGIAVDESTIYLVSDKDGKWKSLPKPRLIPGAL